MNWFPHKIGRSNPCRFEKSCFYFFRQFWTLWNNNRKLYIFPDLMQNSGIKFLSNIRNLLHTILYCISQSWYIKKDTKHTHIKNPFVCFRVRLMKHYSWYRMLTLQVKLKLTPQKCWGLRTSVLEWAHWSTRSWRK